MYSRKDLIEDVSRWGIPRDATVLIHSSMKAVGPVEGGADGLGDALVQFFSPGLVVLPTHTWATIHTDGAVFDPEESPSCVGVITDRFWRRPDAVRSKHPTHSVAAVGKDAAGFAEGEENTRTPCPRQGVYGRLVDRDAYIVFVGVPMTKNTFVHGVEEWLEVPNRLSDTATDLYVKDQNGELISVPQHMHQAPIDDVSSNYGKLQEALARFGLLKEGRLGDAKVLVTSARAVYDLASHVLKQAPDLFLTTESVPISMLKDYVPPVTNP